MFDFECWTVESKVNNTARDVVCHTKQVGHDLDVLQAQLVSLFGNHGASDREPREILLIPNLIQRRGII
eukprot:6894458-Prorocentrum_lima.AAC.1